MRTTARVFMCVASVFLTSANIARAADCKPLAIINSVKMESIGGGARYVVPVTIDGKPLKFLLDTGGVVTEITRETAKAMGMTERASNVQIIDVHGNKTETKVIAKTFEMGVMQGKNLDLQVAIASDLPREGVDGILAGDMFRRFDVDMDFGAMRLNYFSQDHCDGKVVYWTERPIAVVPFTATGYHINIPVTIDGHALPAIIDTGADTLMNADELDRVFGVKAGSPEAPLMRESQSDSELKYYSHTFSNLAIEGVTVANPNINIVNDRVSSQRAPSTSIHTMLMDDPHPQLPPVILGMKVLRQLHVYIAYGEKKLYISPAGTGESVLFKNAAPPPPAN